MQTDKQLQEASKSRSLPPPSKCVFIGIPSLTGQVSASIAYILVFLEKWGRENGWAFAPCILTGRSPVQLARNEITNIFLNDPVAKDYEWLLFLDDDMAPRRDLFKLFLATEQYPEHDIFTAMTLCLNQDKKELLIPLVNPAFWKWHTCGGTDGMNLPEGTQQCPSDPCTSKGQMYTWNRFSEDTDLIACGFGVCLIRRKVLADKRLWHDATGTDAAGLPAIFNHQSAPTGRIIRSEDTAFTVKASEAGYKIRYIGGLQVGHYKLLDMMDVVEWADRVKRGE